MYRSVRELVTRERLVRLDRLAIGRADQRIHPIREPLEHGEKCGAVPLEFLAHRADLTQRHHGQHHGRGRIEQA